MNALDSVWQRVERRCNEQRRKQLIPLRAYLIRQDNSHACVLTGRKPKHMPDETSARQLEELVCAQHRQGAISKVEVSAWLSILSAAVDGLNCSGSNIPSTWIVGETFEAPSPFDPANITDLVKVEAWRSGLHQWIRGRSANAPRAEWQAAILLSAVAHGALVDTRKLSQLLELLSKNVTPEFGHGFATFALSLPYRGLGDYHLCRWVLDPVTEMLVWRMPREGANLHPRQQTNSIAHLLQNIDSSISVPKSMGELVDAGATWWMTRSAPIDVNASRRLITTHAIDSRTYNRIYSLSKPGSVASTRDDRSDDNAVALEFDELLFMYPWLNALIEALGGDDKQTASKRCSEIAAEYKDEAAFFYFGWLQAMLRGLSHSGNPISLAGIKRRFSVTTACLLGTLGDQCPYELESEELEDIYAELLLDTIPDVSRTDLAKGLHDLHFFLVKKYGKKPLRREREIFGDDHVLKPVDANFPDFDDYVRAQAWLDAQLANGRAARDIEIAKIVLMLGFRLGMRRMEIFGLRIDDLHLDYRPWIVVRPHRARRLKTTSSQRLLPAYAFLDQSEKDLLTSWHQCRIADLNNREVRIVSEEFLFEEFGKSGAMTWVDRICDLVCAAIRDVTGDHHLFLHHLRHAFGTLTYLRLRAGDLPVLAQQFESTSLTARILRASKRFRARLLSRADILNRSYAVAVGKLLGHSSPAVSLAHYIHVEDMVIGAAAWRESEHLPNQVMIAASGLASSAAYANLNRGHQTLVYAVRNKFAEKPVPESVVESKETINKGGRPAISPIDKPQWIGFDTLAEIFSLAVKNQKNSEHVGQHVGMSVSAVQTILNRAAQWGALIELEVLNGQLIAYPKYFNQKSADWRFIKSQEVRLAEMAIRAPGLYIDGLNIHLNHFNRQKKDVLFHGAKELVELKRYLRFLKSLGIKPDEAQWILRLEKDKPEALPDWVTKAGITWMPSQIRRIDPPSNEKASSYKDGVGLKIVDASQSGKGKLFTMAIFLARLAASLDLNCATNAV